MSIGIATQCGMSRNAAAAGGFLLDTYDAKAAWSLRRLKTAYTGALVEVVRDSDSARVDVSPDNTDWVSLDSSVTVTSGSSSATTLGEFVAASGYSNPDSLGSADNAAVYTWYDQSGNSYHNENTSPSTTCRLISAGVLVTGSHGKPAIYNPDYTVPWDLTDGSGGEHWWHTVVESTVELAEAFVFGVSTYTGGTWRFNMVRHRFLGTADYRFGVRNIVSNQSTPAGQSRLISHRARTTTPFGELYEDGELVATGTNNADDNMAFAGAAGDDIGGTALPRLSELIIRNGAYGSDRSAIEADINSAFSIY